MPSNNLVQMKGSFFMAKPSKVSKFFKNLLTVLLVVIILCTLGLNLLFKDNNSAPSIFGNSFYVMQQVNMLDVSYGDIVISDKNKISEIQPGNVVLCLTSYDDFKEVLRVQEIVQEDGVTYYVVKSDDIDDTSRKLSADRIVAKCTYTNSILGHIVKFCKSWIGIAILIGGSGLILVLMYVSYYVKSRAEELREEEERRARASQNRNRQRRPNPNNNNNNNNNGEPRPHNGESRNNPNRPKNPNPNRRPKNPNHVNPNEPVKAHGSKPIAVTQLSEEESIRQRENVSNMVGSELNSNTQAKEITREFNSAEVIVSQPTNLEAIKIHESKKSNYTLESVHSPNLEQKAVEIKKALSQNENDEANVKPIIDSTPKGDAQISEKEVTIQEPIKPIEPIEPIKEPEPPKPETINVSTNNTDTVKEPPTTNHEVINYDGDGNIKDTIIVIPTEFKVSDKQEEKTKVDTTTPMQTKQPAKPTQKTIRKTAPEHKQPSKISNIDRLINGDDDNFLDDLFKGKETTNSSSAKVSDDILDELLNTIPSTHQENVEPVKSENSKPVTKSTTHRKPTHKGSTVHRPINNKTDDTSFDELLKAIEKEKNSIK